MAVINRLCNDLNIILPLFTHNDLVRQGLTLVEEALAEGADL